MSACLVVMQPTFLPWAGYFNLMAQAEDFIFLDDVQLEKQSWQTRNRLLMNGPQPIWINIPVIHERLTQKIVETRILNTVHWREKTERGFIQKYSKHPHFLDASEVIKLLTSHSGTQLSTLNEAVIRFIALRLGLTPRIHQASELGITGVRTKRLVSFCEHFNAKEYLSPKGSAAYLAEDGFETSTSTQLRFQDYQPSPYTQKGTKEFISHLSILDVLANLGWKKTRDYVING
jgi:WbqC-like protein family